MVDQVTLESYYFTRHRSIQRALTPEICKLSFIGGKTGRIVWLSGVQNSVRRFTSNNIANCLAEQHADMVGTEGEEYERCPENHPADELTLSQIAQIAGVP